MLTRCNNNESPDQGAAVQTRAMVAKEGRPPKPLQIKSISGLNVGPDELLAAQKADKTLTKYWDLVDKPTEHTQKATISCEERRFIPQVLWTRKPCCRKDNRAMRPMYG